MLPSHAENFAVVVAEALAHGTPVVTTQATPWAELVGSRCGWWIEAGVDPLRHAIREALSVHPAELRAMGERGRALIAGRYDWKRISQDMLDFYRWLRGRMERPSFVHLWQ